MKYLAVEINDITNIAKKRVCRTYKLEKMKKVTPKDYQSFIQIYKGLPERSAVKAPKTEFVEEIAALCMCSTKTVRMWIHGVQKPDALKQKMISDKLGVPADILFPVTE